MYDFFINLNSLIKYKPENKINNINRCVNDYYKMSKNNKYYGLKHDVMKISDIHTLSFFIQIDWNIYFGFTIAENRKRNYICKQNKFDDISRQIISYDSIKWNRIRNDWWICWKYPKNRLDFYRFDSDIIFDLIDEKKRVQIVANLVEEIIFTINEIKMRTNASI